MGARGNVRLFARSFGFAPDELSEIMQTPTGQLPLRPGIHAAGKLYPIASARSQIPSRSALRRSTSSRAT